MVAFRIQQKKNRLTIIRLVALLWALALMTGCISNVDLEGQLKEQSRLVAYCRLCPQFDTTYITLTHTQLLYTKNPSAIHLLSDAVVELSNDGEHWMRAAYSSELQRYFLTQTEFPIEEGATYYLRANADGFDEISSECTVPTYRETFILFDTVSVEHDEHYGAIVGVPHHDCYIQWKDYPGEENYYAYYDFCQYYAFSDWYPITLEEDDKEISVVADQGRDGQTLRFLYQYDIFDELYRTRGGSEEDETEVSSFWCIQMDRHCYLYETSYSEADPGLSMFLLEPVQTYSNIQGGFGLFGGFSMKRIDIPTERHSNTRSDCSFSKGHPSNGKIPFGNSRKSCNFAN